MGKSETKWAWYVGHSDEVYCIGPCESRRAAIDEAIADGGFLDNEAADGEFAHAFFVVEATKPIIRLSEYFDASEWIEELEVGPLADYAGEDGETITHLSEREQEALQVAVRATIDAWQDEKKPSVKPWRFASMRNEERIVIRCDAAGEPLDVEA